MAGGRGRGQALAAKGVGSAEEDSGEGRKEEEEEGDGEEQELVAEEEAEVGALVDIAARPCGHRKEANRRHRPRRRAGVQWSSEAVLFFGS